MIRSVLFSLALHAALAAGVIALGARFAARRNLVGGSGSGVVYVSLVEPGALATVSRDPAAAPGEARSVRGNEPSTARHAEGSAGKGAGSPRTIPLDRVVGGGGGNRPPGYPDEALARGWEGDVKLLLRFGEGAARPSVTVAESSGFPILDEEAVAAASEWRLPGNWEESLREFVVPVAFRIVPE